MGAGGASPIPIKGVTALRRLAAWLLLTLALLALVGCGQQPVGMKLSTEVSGRDVLLRIDLQNFALPKDGHVHLYLDDIADPVMIQRTSYTFHNLRPGQHTIRVQLTDPDHNPLKEPETDQKLTVTIA